MSNLQQIKQKAMLVSLNIKKWGNSKKDSDVSEAAKGMFKADQSAGHFSKKLLPDCVALEKINKIASEARKTHGDLTMPWKDDGSRMLPVTNFQLYRDRMHEHTLDFETAVNNFLTDYANHLNDAAGKLGDMFKPSEYPSESEVKSKFNLSYELNPLPEASDLRLDIDETALAQLQIEIEERTANKVSESFTKVIVDTAEFLADFAERLEEYGDSSDRRLRDALLLNVRKMTANLETFNIFNIPEVSAIKEELNKALEKLTPDMLREDEGARKNAARAAKEAAAKLADFGG